LPLARAASSLSSNRTIRAAVFVWAIIAPTWLGAQTLTARLRVDVRDASQSAVAAADVGLATTGAPLARAVTDTTGSVTFRALRPGRYTVTVTAPGFRTAVVRDVALTDGLQSTLAVQLTAGGFGDQTVVTATGASVRTGVATVGRSFDGDTLRSQPSSERDVLTFVQQAAGVVPPAPGSRLSTQGNTALNSSGGRESANNFLIDGLDNNDLFLNRLIVNPSLDAVAEVTLRQNTYDAEFGRSAGARVDMIMKSGTSVLAGSGYEFFRPSPRHLFGGTLGGPVRHDGATFFFVSGEGIIANEEDTRRAHVPTLAERNGDFSASGVTIIDPFTGAPFPGNVIPAGRISSASRAAAALYPLPNQASTPANFSTSPDATRRSASLMLKADHRLHGDDLVSLRYSFGNDRRDFPFVARNRDLPGFGLADLDRGQSLGLALTQVLSPRILHTLRAGLTLSRRDNLPGQHGRDGFAALGITGPSLSGDDLAYPTILVSGFETIGDDANLPVVRRTRTWHVADTVTTERGRHQLKAGAELRTYRSDGDNHLFSRGRMSFSGAFTGNGFADLLLGYPSFSLLGVNDNRQALRTWSLAGFLQDEWRASARVTISAGLRYEFNAPPTDADNRMRVFDQQRLALVDVGTNGVPASGVFSDANNVAPRLGLSWDPTGRGTTIVRGGYGIFYDSGTLIENSALYFNPPYYSLQLFFPTATSLLRIENPYPSGRGLSPLTSVNSVDQHFRTAYTHQVSASVEHTIAGTTFTGRYVGAFGRNLVRKRNLNQPVPGPGAIDARRPLAGFGDILMVESQARSTYHGLQVSLDRRLQQGLEAHAAYTLSRSMDDASAFLASDGNDNTPQDSRNLGAEWGRSDFDARHRFVASVTWSSTGARESWMLRNWQVSALFTAQSGRPFTPRLSVDNSNTGNTGGATFASDRPDVLTGTPAPGQATFSYGGQTFVMPARYTFGNAGRNILTGPGYAALDALVSRRFDLGGHRRMELRAEVFNVLNRYNGRLPDSFVDHATFGQSLAAFPPRQFQIAARIVF
jgi:hypothetical protein